MKEVVILSGKGGTGKTSIVVSFAAIAQNKVMADCDVDAADLHLLLNPSVKEKNEFRSGQVAVIDKDKCIGCKTCILACPFGAPFFDKTDRITVKCDYCDGEPQCVRFCETGAIKFVDASEISTDKQYSAAEKFVAALKQTK